MKHVLFILGTRPEAIKLAPVIRRLRKSEVCKAKVILTGQHRELVQPIFNFFDITADYDLDIMEEEQGLFDITIRIMQRIRRLYKREEPDAVIVQGDTTSAMVTAQAAFYMKIPIIHVEAGLRSGNRYNPFPEEMNRIQISHLTNLHLAPTSYNREALLRENISDSSIVVTGNPVIDALNHILNRLEDEKGKPEILEAVDPESRLILLTTHRRENWGEAQKNIFEAVRTILEQHRDAECIFPAHPNPNVTRALEQWLQDHPRLHLCEPLDYVDFLRVMNAAYLVMTDSGGIQEEAPALGKPVLILRQNTERMEIVESGNGSLVGTDQEAIVRKARQLLTDTDLYRQMSKTNNLYGEGDAAVKCVEAIENFLTSFNS